eukprot:Blabericola_migrator_1__10718@NODE_612_length_7289_cov_45_683606_g445_i0_p1_GENE_NODE_612_length_7289_cov_45_683606_g445_i0NODE_612_length_7289_cov_45_683606_g445_i0_p1_ORF_typecomplete_len555_score65_52Bestrophin/PF01062_21/4_9e18YoqO/PF14037_6/1_9e03YoqO/PF14037_6/42YoqO/PF14037_6/27_NODE_612_length_7289_cov_45_683606_g445_i017743438
MAVDYRMRKWYDHWLVMTRIRGSVIPRTLVSIVVSLILTAIFHEAVINQSLLGEGGGLMGTPSVYTLFTTSASFILAFTTGICYNRFWEALGHMYQMSNRMGLAATLALAPHVNAIDKMSDEQWTREKRWRAEFLHDISVLHAVCIQTLFSEYVEAPLDILGGMTAEEQVQLAAVKDQPALVFNWIARSICIRLQTDANTIMMNNTTTLLTAALTDWNNAKKVSRVPLPLPFQQALAWADLIITICTPITVACFTQDLWMSLAMTFAAVLVYHGVYMADVAMQQPFGTRSTDLPLIPVHRDFIRRILSFVTAEVIDELNSIFVSQEGPREPEEEASTVLKIRGFKKGKPKHLGFKTASLTEMPNIRTKKRGSTDFPLRNRSEPALSPPPDPDDSTDESAINLKAGANTRVGGGSLNIPNPPLMPSRSTDQVSISPSFARAITMFQRKSQADSVSSHTRTPSATRLPGQLITYRHELVNDTFIPPANASRSSVDRPPQGVFAGDKILAKEYVMPPANTEEFYTKSTPSKATTPRRSLVHKPRGSTTTIISVSPEP